MGSFLRGLWVAIINVLRHPATTSISLVAGLASIATLLTQMQASLQQLAAIHGFPAHFQAEFTNAIDALGAVVSVALIVASCGRSMLASLPSDVVPPPLGPQGGNAAVLPFSSPASTNSTEANQSSLDERKAA